MDFFEHQEKARRGTLWLVTVFTIAVIMVILSVYAASVGIVALVEREHPEQIRLWIPELFAAVSVCTLIIITSGSFYKIWQIGGSGEQVALSLGGREINANSRDLGERILLNVVEEMALASGTPVPPVYVMDEETGINAFAAGTTPQNAVVGVTRGAIDTLSRDQLQGVIGHEFSHILNGDMRLNIRLMGWLHGILLLAMIGYIIMRIVGEGGRFRSSSSSSSSSDKKGEGGLVVAIFVAGIALVIIGYVGVFFAQLIKAAVSRQREFLADASAVQFTRNPDGISSALMKIGGWKDHAKIKAATAEEASHMFFGSALTANLFATHPPLVERIRRMKPDFDGTFQPVGPVRHSSDEIIDPRSLAMERGEAAIGLAGAPAPVPLPKNPRDLDAAHAVAVAGADHVADDPQAVVQSIGQPSIEHIQQIHGLVDQLEPILATNIRDPLGAISVVYALLLAPADSPMRQTQWESLRTSADALVISELGRVLPAVDRLQAEQRLPVACLALPALHQLSPAQTLDFQNVSSALIRMDNRTTLFEFAVQRFIAKRLVARLHQRPAKLISARAIKEFQADFVLVLSTLARVGDPQNPRAAFDAGLNALDQQAQALKNSQLLESNALSVPALDQALDKLELASPKSKRTMLAAFAACIAADHRVSVQEGELLRVIADALGCPVPPIV